MYYIWKHLQNQEGSDGKFVNKVWDLCTIYGNICKCSK